MVRKTILALLLLLMLTACGGEAPEDGGGRNSFLGECWGRDEEQTLLQVEGREVPAWRYLCWLARTARQLEEEYRAAGLPLDWEAPVSGGTLADYARDQALADTVLCAVIEDVFQESGLPQPEAEAAVLPPLGLLPDQQEELETVGRKYRALLALGEAEENPQALTEQDWESLGAVTLRQVSVPLGEDPAAAERRIGELFSRLNGAEDPEAVFDAWAAEGEEVSQVRTVLPEETDLPGELLEAARALEPGQSSGILESEGAYTLLLRLPTDRAALGERCLEEKLRQRALAAEVTLTPAYRSLRPSDFSLVLPEPGEKE